MTKRIELKPLAELGRGYALIDDGRLEVRVNGIMGALKVWLIGESNVPIGNVTGGKLVRETDTRPYRALLITQSGRQMFYGQWREAVSAPEPEKEAPAEPEKAEPPEPENPWSPLPDLSWVKITGRDFPTADERVRFALSNNAFYAAFKRHKFYLFGRDGDRYALAVKHTPGDPAPFPCTEGAKAAGEYIYVVI